MSEDIPDGGDELKGILPEVTLGTSLNLLTRKILFEIKCVYKKLPEACQIVFSKLLLVHE